MSWKHRWGVCAELMGRHIEVWRHHWRARDTRRLRVLTKNEAEFLPAALAVQEHPASRSARWLIWLLAGLVACTLVWSFVGRMDIVVNAVGKVVPSSRVKTLASVDTASVVALHVVEGQAVHAGEALVELDASSHDAARDKALADAQEAVLQLARNEALLEGLRAGRLPRLPAVQALQARFPVLIDDEKWQAAGRHVLGQYQDYAARQARLDADMTALAQQIPLADQQARVYQELAATQDVPLIDVLAKEQALVQLRGQRLATQRQRSALAAETRRIVLDEIVAARRAVTGAVQDAARYTAIGRLYTLKAPVDGTVQQLAVHTIGGVVSAAQPLMQIVPRDGPVEIEAFIENRDQGFVRAGQAAAVKLDAYDYTKYGTLPAHITHVSQDAIDDSQRGLIYSIHVRLDRPDLDIDGRRAPVTPGMAAHVEIKTGNRRIIEYVLSPLMRHAHEALNER